MPEHYMTMMIDSEEEQEEERKREKLLKFSLAEREKLERERYIQLERERYIQLEGRRYNIHEAYDFIRQILHSLNPQESLMIMKELMHEIMYYNKRDYDKRDEMNTMYQFMVNEEKHIELLKMKELTIKDRILQAFDGKNILSLEEKEKEFLTEKDVEIE
jgi:hypothetical protein